MDHEEIEKSIEAQLKETKDSLSALKQISHGDNDPNEEHTSLEAELHIAIKHLEESLALLREEKAQTESTSESASEPELPTQQDGYVEQALNEMELLVKQAVKNGQQIETVYFAEWEAHGRGVASKLMAKMGYVHGKGLGRNKQGMTEALVSKSNPSSKKAGLGTEDADELGSKSKTKRGGRMKTARKRRRLAQEAMKEEESQKEMETSTPGVFAVLNRVIGDHSRSAKAKKARKGVGKGDTTDAQKRGALASQLGKIEDCKQKVAHFESAVKRNEKNKGMMTALEPQLKAAQEELAYAESHHAKLSKEIERKVKHNQYRKF